MPEGPCGYCSLLTLSSVAVQTLAYLLPVLTKAIQNAEKEFLTLQQQGRAHDAGTLQALVVVPSRELAIQIVRVAQGLLPHEARATIQQCIGGANPNRQVSCNLHKARHCCSADWSPASGTVLVGFQFVKFPRKRDTCSVSGLTQSSVLCFLNLTYKHVSLWSRQGAISDQGAVRELVPSASTSVQIAYLLRPCRPPLASLI